MRNSEPLWCHFSSLFLGMELPRFHLSVWYLFIHLSIGQSTTLLDTSYIVNSSIEEKGCLYCMSLIILCLLFRNFTIQEGIFYLTITGRWEIFFHLQTLGTTETIKLLYVGDIHRFLSVLSICWILTGALSCCFPLTLHNVVLPGVWISVSCSTTYVQSRPRSLYQVLGGGGERSTDYFNWEPRSQSSRDPTIKRKYRSWVKSF